MLGIGASSILRFKKEVADQCQKEQNEERQLHRALQKFFHTALLETAI